MTPPIDGSATKTLWAGLLFVCLTLIGFLLLRYSIVHNAGTPIPGDPGPFFLPTICLVAIGATGVFLIGHCAVMSVSKFRTPIRFATFDVEPRTLGLTLGFVLTLCLIPTAMMALGTFYVVTAFATLWIYVFLVAGHGHSLRNGIEAVGLGFATAIFINIVFVRILALPLPA